MMEVVRVFNNELSSLYEVRPPISKAKMTQITKSAIKGIKYYKHIVQSVEKFIQKCRPEYKVPGLYVVDSIVRQSRHQFGADKDVFGPRFVKNITTTFQHLFKCAEDDRPKIIRVLNLWQKNTVFPIEVIQPLMDMGHPNTSNEWPLDTSGEVPKESPVKMKEETRHKSDSWKGWPQANEEEVHDSKQYAEMSTKNLEKFNKAEMSNAVKEEETSRSAAYKNQAKIEKLPEETVKFNKKLLDFDYGDEEDEEDIKNEENLSTQPNALALSMAQNLLSNPELLRQLQQMTATTIQQTEALKDTPVLSHSMKVDVEENEVHYSQDMQSSPQLSLIPPTSYQQPIMSHNLLPLKSESDTDDRVLPEPTLPTRDLDERSLASVMASHDRLLPSVCLPAFPQTGVPLMPPLPDKDDRIIPDPPLPTRDFDERSLASIIAPPDRATMPPIPFTENSNLLQFQYDKNGIPFQAQPSLPMMESMNMEAAYSGIMPPDQHMMQNSQGDEDERVMYSMPGEPPLPPHDFDERQILPAEERSLKERSRSRSGSRNRRSGRRRSRSRSPRRKRAERSRSRSRSRKNRSRSRERERKREKEMERERERERRRKGLPPVKKGCVSVCSTTIWLGHVPKSCSEVDINETFGSFGNILSIDMIPPRGCAYIVMERRQDGHRALQKLRNVKLQGSSIKMAWAPGKGVKGKEYKECWEVESGVSYVPYEKIREDPEALELLEEGGFIDEDTLPDHLKAMHHQSDGGKPHTFNTNNQALSEANPTFNEIQPVPNMVPPPPIMPPTSVGLPMVLPHLMQPQFGLHLPGMLPPQAMVMQVPMGIPPPAPMLMLQQQSQGIMGSQPLSMVGGAPQMIPRTIPPVTTPLPNLKNAEPVLPSPAAPTSITTSGDATPTEEDGTNVSSPSVPMTIPGTVSLSTMPVPSTQAVSSMAQYSQMLNCVVGGTRPMLSVPPPVSTTGTPIPYPPPHVGFNFPPPGLRPPGQAHALHPNAQFPWMQKQIGSPFTEADSTQSATNPATIRPVPPPQPGMPLHMFANRPPFHEPQPSASVNSQIKDAKGRDTKSGETEKSDNRNASSNNHDKMNQEMVISTDDESSMDIEYNRNDMSAGSHFPGVPEFSRSPMNIQRMRSPMLPSPRFPPSMPIGSPFPMRMGGPRGMGVPGIHGRMEGDFLPHGPHGPRMPIGPRGPRRNDNMQPPHDGRDWYPRDFESPQFELERDRRFRDDWGREDREPRDSWNIPSDMEGDQRRNSRDHDETRRDDRREPWNRTDSSRSSRDNNAANDSSEKPRADSSRSSRDNNTANDSSEKPKNKPPNKSKSSKNMMDDLLKLRSYQRGGGGSTPKPNRNDQTKDKPVRKEEKMSVRKEEKIEKLQDINIEQQTTNVKVISELTVNSKNKKDRESRKRSRWGRTLSEEREFQEQRRNELEMKFQSYEQSHAAQQPAQNSAEIPIQNSNETPVVNAVDVPIDNSVRLNEVPEHNISNIEAQNSIEISEQNLTQPYIQSSDDIPTHNTDTVVQHTVEMAIPKEVNNADTVIQNTVNIVPKEDDDTDTVVVKNTVPEVDMATESHINFSEETNVLTDIKVSKSNNELVQKTSASWDPSKVIDSVSCESGVSEGDTSRVSLETDVSENDTVSVRLETSFSENHTSSVSHETRDSENNTSTCEIVSDLNVISGVTDSTSNENEVMEDVNTNNSLVSSES